MGKRNLSIMMASAAILGTSMVGCSSTGSDSRPALAENHGAVSNVEKSFVRKDYARALLQAENLVAAEPRNGDYRALLGRAYLANGRYASARTAFTDAMTLGNREPRTIVSLAMAETGLGQPAVARELLVDHVHDLPAGDYGLAMTMAGNAKEGVRALIEAARSPDATAKTRQNLAYALAMAGAWGQARLIAGQDLSAKEAEKRVGEWAWIAREGKESDRVVAMIGVAPRADDAGLPQRLALDTSTQPDASATQLASTDDLIDQASKDAKAESSVDKAPPAAAPVATKAAPEAVAAAPEATPRAAQPSQLSQPETLAAAFQKDDSKASPVVKAQSAQTNDTLAKMFANKKPNNAETLAGRAKMSRVAQIAVPADDAEASDWVVQLGAFDSEAVAQDKWQRIRKHREALQNFKPVNSVFELNGRTFHRLAIRGFGDRDTALSTCTALRGEGQACFVRLDDTDSTRLARAEAQRKAERLAAADGKKGDAAKAKAQKDRVTLASN